MFRCVTVFSTSILFVSWNASHIRNIICISCRLSVCLFRMQFRSGSSSSSKKKLLYTAHLRDERMRFVNTKKKKASSFVCVRVYSCDLFSIQIERKVKVEKEKEKKNKLHSIFFSLLLLLTLRNNLKKKKKLLHFCNNQMKLNCQFVIYIFKTRLGTVCIKQSDHFANS